MKSRCFIHVTTYPISISTPEIKEAPCVEWNMMVMDVEGAVESQKSTKQNYDNIPYALESEKERLVYSIPISGNHHQFQFYTPEINVTRPGSLSLRYNSQSVIL